MKKITVEFEALFKATLEVPDDASDEDIEDAVAEIDIPRMRSAVRHRHLSSRTWTPWT